MNCIEYSRGFVHEVGEDDIEIDREYGEIGIRLMNSQSNTWKEINLE